MKSKINVNEILNDLYKVDPALREMEAELKDIIEKLAGNRPESEPDQLFKERLKQELLNKIQEDRSLAPSSKKAAEPQSSRAGQAGDKKQKRKILPFRRVAFFRAAGLTAAAAFAVIFGLQFFNIREDGISPIHEAVPPLVSMSDKTLPLSTDITETDGEKDIKGTDTEGGTNVQQPAKKEAATAPAPRPESVNESPAPSGSLPGIASADDADGGGEMRAPAESKPDTSPSLLNKLFGTQKSAARSEGLMMMQEAPVMSQGYAADMVTEAEEMDFFADEEVGAVPPETAAAVEFNTEEYDRIRENDFVAVMDEPMSTFSIDVDTASYANVRRYLTGGSLPPADAVRIEELINYFDYDYPAPVAGAAPFSFNTETTRCPWNQENLLLQIGLQGYEVSRAEMPPSNLVFLLDVSGSMSDANKLPLLKQSLALLIDTLDQDDRVSIVAYAGAAGLVLPPTGGNEKRKILAAMDRLESGGSTAGGEGIELAYRTALENFKPDGNNRVLIATDGDFNVGPSSEGELTRIIEEKREQGIFLTVLGLGMGNYKDSRMESLADSGNGNYAYIDTINEARKVLVNEMESTLLTIAKDVKIQIEFNPAIVSSYRLIGYENRVLANRDFDDDSKDAGEIGAGHTVTVLYEIIPSGSRAAESTSESTELRYQETTVKPEAADTSAFAGELGFIKFRYKAPDEDQSTLISSPVPYNPTDFGQAGRNLRFAATVAEWGMRLRGSAYLPEKDSRKALNDLIRTTKDSLGEDEYGYRAEFLTLLYKTRDLMN